MPPAPHLAYPLGDARRTPRVVRALGFESGCPTKPGTVTRAIDRYRGPRLYVDDGAAGELERRLEELAPRGGCGVRRWR